jgi:hypothetical protein
MNEFDLSPHQGQTLQPYVEQNASMMQQMATAQIQSRYQVALRFPRDPDVVRQKMLAQCDRPTFFLPDESKNGSSVAIYRVPRGGNTIEDVTIRFAEMAMRAHGNMSTDIVILGEDSDKCLYQVACTDYESNNTHTEIVGVSKLVERSYVKDGDVVVSQRMNSKNKPVYRIVGTEDDIQGKRNALFSKSKRNLIKAQIDQGLIEECKTRLKENAAKKDAEDPEGAKKKLYDAFNAAGVSATDLNSFLGHTNKLSPAELGELRGYYAAIVNGYATWKEILAERNADDGKDDDADQQAKQEQLDKLFADLSMTPAQIRNIKAKYVNRPGGLLKYLQDQLAKKANDGGEKAVEGAIDTKPQEIKREEKKEETKPKLAEVKQQAPVVEPKPESAPAPTSTAVQPTLDDDDKW